MEPLPPPFLSTEPLGPPPAPGNGSGPALEDPLLSAYDRPAELEAEGAGVPIGPDEVTAFLVGFGDVLAKLREDRAYPGSGDHWKIEPGELELVSPAIARQLAGGDSAFTQWLVAHSDALIIGVSALAVLGPRAAREYQWIRYRRELARREQEGPTYDYPGGIDAAAAASLGAGPGLPDDGSEGGAGPRPTDPRSLTAALSGLDRRQS